VSISCHHELETARINDLLGNIDANTGDPQVGMCVYCLVHIIAMQLSEIPLTGLVTFSILTYGQVGTQMSFLQIFQRLLWLCQV
jgi:xylose isomerase